MERLIERVLFASRWLMVPLCLGLAALLVMLVTQFFLDLYSVARASVGLGKSDLLVEALGLLDLVLVASLIVMVMLGAFESFVARITLTDSQQRLPGLAKLDTGSIKVKTLTAIVVIAAIDLLKAFLNIDKVATERLGWLVAIMVVFVLTALGLAVQERMSDHESKD